MTPHVMCDQNAVSLFQPGSNCWRVEPAHRAAFLIDGKAYFSAFREAAIQARKSLFILGWDFDTRIRMLIDCEPDGYPDQLGPFLQSLLVKRRTLHIYVLVWDFHVLYVRERQWWLPSNLSAQRRLHFVKDGCHPVGASHHQKIVVVDDAVAFTGGFDLACCRWDTSQHRGEHPARTLPTDHAPCRPFHDVQMLVDGPVAASLGLLARERWQIATGERIESKTVDSDPWPKSLSPHVSGVRVAIARTIPQWEDRAPVHEIQRLIIDLFRSARRCIYIETQYLTSKVLTHALCELLSQGDGPDVVMILHPNSDGWLEQHTMDVLRGRVLKQLRAADRYHHLALYYPALPDLKGQCISVHSKVCVIDDTCLRIGSANMSNRSLGLDTECDLAIEASGDAKVESAIAAFRNHLLAEHLDVLPDEVAHELHRHPRLIASIEALRGKGRTPGRSLEVFDTHIPEEVDELVPDDEFIDPSRPYETQIIPEEHRPSVRRQLIIGVGTLCLVLALAAVWRWSPFGEWLELPRLLTYVEHIEDNPAAPFITVGAFVGGGLLVIPVTLLIAVTILAFGPLYGFVYSFVGMTLSALVTFVIGRVMGRQVVEQWSRRLHHLSRRLAKQGVLAVVAVRVLPVAPFSVVNMLAGATHISARDFVLGTIIGELPGLLAISIFVDQVSNSIQHPSLGSYAVLAASVAVILGGVWLLRRWLTRRVATPSTVS